MTKKNYEMIWVSSSFKRKLKTEAALAGKTILDYTRMLAKGTQKISEDDEKAKKKVFKFGL